MNDLTHEQIGMLTKLQPLFKEKMGEWQIRDEGWTEGLGMGVLYHNGLMYFDNGTRINPMWCDEILRIPKSIDWQNENRGLLGMFSVPPILHFNPYLNKWCCERMHKNITKIDDYYAEDPFTALLKALTAQEGV